MEDNQIRAEEVIGESEENNIKIPGVEPEEFRAEVRKKMHCVGDTISKEPEKAKKFMMKVLNKGAINNQFSISNDELQAYMRILDNEYSNFGKEIAVFFTQIYGSNTREHSIEDIGCHAMYFLNSQGEDRDEKSILPEKMYEFICEAVEARLQLDIGIERLEMELKNFELYKNDVIRLEKQIRNGVTRENYLYVLAKQQYDKRRGDISEARGLVGYLLAYTTSIIKEYKNKLDGIERYIIKDKYGVDINKNIACSFFKEKYDIDLGEKEENIQRIIVKIMFEKLLFFTENGKIVKTEIYNFLLEDHTSDDYEKIKNILSDKKNKQITVEEIKGQLSEGTTDGHVEDTGFKVDKIIEEEPEEKKYFREKEWLNFADQTEMVKRIVEANEKKDKEGRVSQKKLKTPVRKGRILGSIDDKRILGMKEEVMRICDSIGKVFKYIYSPNREQINLNMIGRFSLNTIQNPGDKCFFQETHSKKMLRLAILKEQFDQRLANTEKIEKGGREEQRMWVKLEKELNEINKVIKQVETELYNIEQKIVKYRFDIDTKAIYASDFLTKQYEEDLSIKEIAIQDIIIGIIFNNVKDFTKGGRLHRNDLYRFLLEKHEFEYYKRIESFFEENGGKDAMRRIDVINGLSDRRVKKTKTKGTPNKNDVGKIEAGKNDVEKIEADSLYDKYMLKVIEEGDEEKIKELTLKVEKFLEHVLKHVNAGHNTSTKNPTSKGTGTITRNIRSLFLQKMKETVSERGINVVVSINSFVPKDFNSSTQYEKIIYRCMAVSQDNYLFEALDYYNIIVSSFEKQLSLNYPAVRKELKKAIDGGLRLYFSNINE